MVRLGGEVGCEPSGPSRKQREAEGRAALLQLPYTTRPTHPVSSRWGGRPGKEEWWKDTGKGAVDCGLWCYSRSHLGALLLAGHTCPPTFVWKATLGGLKG